MALKKSELNSSLWASCALRGGMDAEMEALEAKLSRARLVKQGMVQERLTGRVLFV